MSTTVTPSNAQLGVALRSAASAARRLGDDNKWRPAEGTPAFRAWKDADPDANSLALTLTEADVHAVLLLRSAIALTEEVGRKIAKLDAYLPLPLGRIAIEHSLRSLHLTDSSATDGERASRRLNEWLYAISEGERQRSGFVKKSNLINIPNRSGGQIDAVRARARQLNLDVHKGAKELRVGSKSRASGLSLAETYLSGEASGIGEFLMRGHGASIHGLETALLGSATGEFDDRTDIMVPTPSSPASPEVAYSLLGVPLSFGKSFRNLSAHFGWTGSSKLTRDWDRSQDALLRIWSQALESN